MSWTSPALAPAPGRVAGFGRVGDFATPPIPGYGLPPPGGGASAPPASPTPPYYDLGPGIAKTDDGSSLYLWAIPFGLVLVGGVLLGAGVFRRIA